jgi:hypothetical protein
MSTRGCIARVTSKEGETMKFKGVYLHYDNCPSGTGRTLFNLRNGHFKGSTDEMLKVLITQHKKGWSSINGNFDWNLPPTLKANPNTEICKHCNKPNWVHYAQYYNENNPLWIEAGRPECPVRTGESYRVSDHSPEPIEVVTGPICQAGKGTVKDLLTEKNASQCGCEYVYAFTKDGNTMYVLSSYTLKGEKAIGMFGMGDPNADWKIIGKIDLNGKSPTNEEWDTVPIKQGTEMSKEEFKELADCL